MSVAANPQSPAPEATVGATPRGELALLLNTLANGTATQAARSLARLMALPGDIGLVGILACYHHLPANARDDIAGYADRFKRALSHLINSGDEQTRFNCIEFVSRSGQGQYASLLGDATADNNLKIADQAISVIQTSVRNFLGRRIKQALAPSIDSFNDCRVASDGVNATDHDYDEMRSLLDVLGRAVESLEIHQRGDLLDTLVRMGGRGDMILLQELRSALGRGKAKDAILTEMRERPRTATMMLLFSMLESGSAVLRRMAEELLSRCDRGESHEILLSIVRSKGPNGTAVIARRLKDLPWLKPLAASLNELDEPMLLAWIDAIGEMRADLPRKLELLRCLLICSNESVIQAIFDVIGNHYIPSVRPLLVELAESRVEAIRFHALAALSRARFEGRAQLMKDNLRNDSGRIRLLAMRAVAEEQFDRLLRAFDSLDERGREVFASVIDPNNTEQMSKLIAMLKQPEARQRLRALRVVSHIGILEPLQNAVLALTQDPDRRIRSYVSRLLSRLKNADAARFALRLLSDVDTRVRANAIEAVEEFGHVVFQKALVPFLQSPAARERANAAKAVYALGSPLALRILEHMGKHSIPTVRMSSVWALANIRERITIKHAFDIAKFEPDSGVQRRMLRIIDSAEENLREIEYQESQKLLAIAA